MEEWKEYTIGDIAGVKGGKRLPKGVNLVKEPNTHPYIRVRDLNSKKYLELDNTFEYVDDKTQQLIARYIVNAGDIIISIVGTIGLIAIIGESLNNANLTENCVKLVDIRRINRDYLYYYLISDWGKQEIEKGIVGAVQAKLPIKNIQAITIKAPCEETQRRIASILSSLDDKIEVNRRINENLEAQAQALFKSWFVDFEPFRDGEFVESELGMIPKGWRVYKMDELVDWIGGYSYKGNELQESTTAMATIKNFERNGGFKINGFKEIVPSSKAKHEQFLKKFDVIIAHTDLTQNADIIGNPALILHFGKYERLIMSMDLVKVKSKSDYITYGLLYCFFSDARFKSHALGYVNGTTVLHLSKKAIPEYKLALPHDLSILAIFCKTFDSIFAKEAEMMEETDLLATLRDTLLPRLMSGELKVNEVGL